MLHSGSGGRGCPLATGPSGLKPEPKAPCEACSCDSRHPLGLPTGSADIRPMQHNCARGWGFIHKYVIKVTHNSAASLSVIPLPQQE